METENGVELNTNGKLLKDTYLQHVPFIHFSCPLWALLQLKANWLLVALPDATSGVD